MSDFHSQNSAVRDEAIAAWARIRNNVLCCENGSKIHHNLLYAVDAFFKSTQLSEMVPLKRIADKLGAAGATLPAPENKGTIESAMTHGLCIALALVEAELNAAPGCGGQASGRTVAPTSTPADEHSPESAFPCVVDALDRANAAIGQRVRLLVNGGSFDLRDSPKSFISTCERLVKEADETFPDERNGE